ncbi:transcriptional regulator BolA [Parasalinivibrio latis]|uniref:transcriptional regulator BolA n=1 Tax=Parasalinivibrio latis TaxID=2952610 RepID=UPI0030E1CCF7
MIKTKIEEKLREAFKPAHLEVVNESFMHNVPSGSESHFKVVIVSGAFDNQRLLTRHRAVNQVLSEELQNDIHALAMHTYTESEWNGLNGQAPVSPPCHGGSKND